MSKKITALLLCAVMMFTCAVTAFAADESQFGAYKRVFIIGVDGAGGFIEDADTPCFDSIFADGAVTYDAKAETITTSAQNWGAILCGVSYLEHGLTNEIMDTETRDSSCKYPTIFKYCRDAFPDAELASFVNWDPINYGLIENDIGVTEFDAGEDGAVCDAICNYFNAGNDPSLFFVQFDSVDHVGHDVGCKDPEYMSQISIVDGYIGRIHSTLEANNLLEDSLFIVVTDHGHTIAGGHGGLTINESKVTVAVAGQGICADGDISAQIRNRDVSAIALYALGIERPSHMTSIVPSGIYEDGAGEDRNFFGKITDFFAKIFRWIKNLFSGNIG